MIDGEASTRQLEEREEVQLKRYALRSAERTRDLGDQFREHREDSPLEYRTQYHRDRDRIVWSTAFRRLQHKTQIFPHYVEDHYRRRLTHSLEVAQISTTLCRALEINEVAAEAMSLAHDLGHTPFGHGGEEALNVALVDLAKKDGTDVFATSVALYGFDHCVQGVEQASRICNEYKPAYFGLNLSFDIRDGILKHIYNQTEDGAKKNGRPFSSLSNIMKLKEYGPFLSNCGSLEAQCVWLADKVAYFLSDIEDAIRAHIFAYQEIAEAGFLRLLWDKYLAMRKETKSALQITSMDDLLSFKRKALTALILDCTDATSKRLSGFRPESLKDIFGQSTRLVDVGSEIREAWNDFYKLWLEGRLYRHDSVKACEFKAAKILRDLFDAYYAENDLIPAGFRDNTSEAYENLLTGKEVKLMVVRNFIAGMTDSFATEQHKKLFMSSERANAF